MRLKLKLQYFGHLMRRADSLEKTLMLGGIVGRRRGGQQRMRWLDGITDSMDMSLSELWETRRPGVLWFLGSQRVGRNWATELNWTEDKDQSLKVEFKKQNVVDWPACVKHSLYPPWLEYVIKEISSILKLSKFRVTLEQPGPVYYQT